MQFYTRLMRWIGGGTLGIAALSFLLTGWVDGSPLLRTGSFLGFTALLTAGGILCSYRWQDDKGARTFLALATAFLPANFAQLAALVHAQLADGSLMHDGLRGTFVFAPVGPAALALTLAGALAVLIPVAYIGFSALARSQARRLTMLFILANSMLLLPSRDGDWVALTAAWVAAALVLAEHRWLSRECALQTTDGRAMRALLYLPVVLLIVRNLVMHSTSWSLLGVSLGLLAAFFYLGLPHVAKNTSGRAASQFFAYILALPAWICLAIAFGGPHFQYNGLPLVLFFLPWATGVFILSLRGAGAGRVTRGLVASMAFCLCWVNLAEFGDTYANVACIMAAVALIISAFILEEKAVLGAGLATLLLGIAYHLHMALTLLQGNLWLSLALAGAVVVLASSCLERNGAAIRLRLQKAHQQWQGWQ